MCITPVTTPTRADELWRHTCFEAFVGTSGIEYYEFNFAPSTQWAAYHFTAYRTGMRIATEAAAPEIETYSTGRSYSLRAVLDLSSLHGLRTDGPFRLGLSAVIEDTENRKSFWSLAHPAGKPDFHNADCFLAETFAG